MGIKAIKLTNGKDVRTLAGFLELDTVVPEGRGNIARSVLSDLAKELVAKNFQVQWTGYFPESLLTETFSKSKTTAGSREWVVTGKRGDEMVSVTVSLKDVRDHAGMSQGSPSKSSIFVVAALIAGWGEDVRITSYGQAVNVSVGDLPMPVVEAESDAETSESTSEGENTGEVSSEAEKPSEVQPVAEEKPAELVTDKPKGRRLVKPKA